MNDSHTLEWINDRNILIEIKGELWFLDEVTKSNKLTYYVIYKNDYETIYNSGNDSCQ